jgi:hypothetical protein
MEFLRKGTSAAAALCLGVIAICSIPISAQSGEMPENDVEAAFLYNFAKYIEWPPATFSGPTGPFHVCAVAERPFIRSLDAILAGETIAGRPVVRTSPETIDEARGCHILYVAKSELGGAQRLLAAVQEAPVLTVSDDRDFLARGGTVAFVRDGNRIRFDVNAARAQNNGLTISSRLLRVARQVTSS